MRGDRQFDLAAVSFAPHAADQSVTLESGNDAGDRLRLQALLKRETPGGHRSQPMKSAKNCDGRQAVRTFGPRGAQAAAEQQDRTQDECRGGVVATGHMVRTAYY